MSALSPEEVIARLRAEGYSDDEVIDHFAQAAAVGRLRPGVRVHPDGSLEWVPGVGGSLHHDRALREWLVRSRGATRDDVTEEEVRAERTRRIEVGEPYGYAELAKHFHCDASTIRRRLGVLIERKTP